MTIASQITALGNNIGAAYNMIGQRGGTVPARKNAENMATAIATIPSGGPTKDYGTVTLADYYDGWTMEVYDATGHIVSSEFETAYQAHKAAWDPYNMKEVRIQSDYSTGYYLGDDYQTIYTVQQLEAFGIYLTVQSGSWASGRIMEGQIIDPTHITQKNITNVYEYMCLGSFVSNSSNTCYIDGQKIPKAAVLGYTFGADCDFIPDGFLCKCTNFSQDITLPEGPTKIPDYFMYHCDNFNSRVIMSSTITEVGDYFLYWCTSFDSQIVFSNSLTKMGVYFLAKTAISTSPTLPASLEELGDFYLTQCDNITSIDIPGTVISVGKSLGQNNANLTSITFHSGTKKIGDEFMYSRSRLWTGTITLPDTLEEIGKNFCSSGRVNTSITLPNTLKKIGDYFMYHTDNFNKPITIPSSVTSIGNSFMGYSVAFTGPLTVNTTALPSGSNATPLTARNNTSASYTTGITIKGSARSTWISALPNRTSSPYRKLINGGA